MDYFENIIGSEEYAYGKPAPDCFLLAAERLELRYGLRLPGREIAPGSGGAHQRACLSALALYQAAP